MAESSPKTQTKSPSDEEENRSKYFLYKAALVTAFLVLVPLFPSLAPDFFNQTLHARSWELLQLIFVGIAVSYGLFSKKNDQPHKDNAQSYVSKLLQVSSVFDDESENHTVIEDSKFEASNSRYYGGEPPVVVALKNSAVEEKNAVVSRISQKPLLLPVRSLKQRVPGPNEADSCSKKFDTSSRKSRSGDVGGLNIVEKAEEEEVEEEEKTVLRSPIPWRSRSGRMEVRESGVEMASTEDQEYSNRIETRPFRPNASAGSVSRSTSFASEPQPRGNDQDMVRKKSFAPPPPAPPPPPSPSLLRKSVLMKSNSSVASNAGSTRKVLARSVRSVPTEELSENGMELRFGAENDGLVKSVRTLRPNEEKESMDYEVRPKEKNKEIKEKVLMDATESEDSEAEAEAEAEEYDNFGAADDDNGNDGGPDVDKKADEFIAKFREQIRLQRIESIRRSTAMRAGKSSSSR